MIPDFANIPLGSQTFTLKFDPVKVFAHDEVSVGIGTEAGMAACVMIEKYGFQGTLNFLDMGTGTGVIPCSFIVHAPRELPTHITAIDNSQDSVDATKVNLTRLCHELSRKPNFIVKNLDWNNESTWEFLEKKKYQIVTFNPPYLAQQGERENGDKVAPVATMYVEGADRYAHYEVFFSKIDRLFAADTGSTIIVRMPQSADDYFYSQLETSLENLSKKISGLSVEAHNQPFSDTHWGNILTITKE